MKVLLFKRSDKDGNGQEILRQLKELKDGEYVISVKKKKHIRSIDQNSYYFAILKIASIHTGDHDVDRLHEICKKKFNGELAHFPKSPVERIGRSTAKLDTGEFSAYVSRVKMWLRDEYDLIIPEKKDTTYQVWAEIEDKYEKTFVG